LAAWLVAFASARASEAPPVIPLPEAVENLQGAQKPPAVPAQVATPQQGAKYVGQDTCLNCHDNMRQGYEGTAHHRAADSRTPAARQGCETCHGPGSAHVENPVEVKVKLFRSMPPGEVNETCVTCHNRGEHALWDGSQHEARDLACTSCHSVHAPKSELFQLKEKTQKELCATCHRDKVSKLDRSGHMPVREGKLECTSCHNVHGTTNVRLLRKGDSVAELCTSCHADKRGPFLWEHAPVRDGCVTCHDPHGSMNERMLVSKPPILCQRCHVATRHPATIYDQVAIASSGVRVYARSCVTCHSAIHGSNHPSGQRFIR
jgi:DmsE family decaheme c-type cytochrome